ncbi:RHS repeat-associated protein [Psychromicrobium silvestre]|uniref:RHS repeat-associated protein n=1 Tax=Psychromicrobium silvestre TaxID=1645614 RepID=A0A7Y9LU46_9MICC|nr:RHS repeat-associated core domain-containing protein [Psychromicrobium silvestre]NYE95609.1 RHS repeat-associated protein [Psychromicrobium silvestre]
MLRWSPWKALLGLFLALATVLPLMSVATPASAVQQASPPSVAVQTNDLFGQKAASSSDIAVGAFGDSAGYHVQIGRESDGFTWRSLAVIKPEGMDSSSWTGYQCLSGDGKYIAVAVLAGASINYQNARDHGAFGYAVEVATGKVIPLVSGVGLRYYSPGCGTGHTAVFSLSLGSNEELTGLVSADLATGKIISQRTVKGEVTSAIPTGKDIVGVLGSSLVRVPAVSSEKKPFVPLASLKGALFNLRPTRTGAVDFLVVTPNADQTQLARFEGNGVKVFGQGATVKVRLFGGRDGVNIISGIDANAPGLKAVDASSLGQPPASSSLDGDAIFNAPAAKPSDANASPSPTTAGSPVSGQVLATATGQRADRSFDAVATKVITAVAGFVPANVLSQPPISEHNTVSPQESKSNEASKSSPLAMQLSKMAPATASTSSSTTPSCAIGRLDPAGQVMQPSNAQVNWATQMAEQGLLSGSTYARPANFENMGLVSYSPSDDFAPIPLDHPSGTTQTTVPRSVMLGILAQESNFNQASWHALPSVPGDPLIANYYGVAGSIDQIDYPNADCGYGIAQVTTGMHAGDVSISHHGQMKIAADYQENIAAGLQILEDTWNQLYESGIKANNADPSKLENWYFALWAYNSGIQPTAAFGNTTGCTPSATCTGPDGTWGMGWSNNPKNPAYPPNRLPFLQSSYADAAHPGDWPYQERVLGWMASPIIRYGYYGFGTPDYHGASWLKMPAVNTMCDGSNHCNPTAANGAYCTLADSECWWSQPATWIGDCATSCATSAYEFGAGSTEPSHADPHPPTCDLGPTVPSGPGGAPIVVDDETSPPLNIVGCGANNWTSNGTFTMSYGQDANGVEVGQIDMHQLGVGFGGRILFDHTQPASEPQVINKGTWTPNLPSLQYYKLKVHFPATGATATDVVYTINPGGGVAPWKIRVNQDWGSEQWATIGTFAMQNGGSVSLDNTSNMTPSGYDVAYDAVAFIPMGGTPGTPIGGPSGIQDAPKGSNPAFVNCGCVARTAGDPVNTQTGYFGETLTDLSTPGFGVSLNLSRTFASALADPNGPNKTLAVNGPFGWGWTYSYGLSTTTDASGNVTVRQEDGSAVSFKLSGGSYTTTAPRFDAKLSKNGSNYTYTRRGNSFFTFDVATGRLISESDLAGNAASPTYSTKLNYDASGHLSTVVDPSNRSYTFTWSGAHITSVKDSASRQIDYVYDASGNLTDVYGVGTTRSGTTKNDADHAQFGYTTAHLMNSMRTPANYGKTTTPTPVTSMVYDSVERVTSQTDPLGRVTTFSYGPNSTVGLITGQTLITDPGGHKTLDSYDTNGLLTSETKGYGSSVAGTWKYTYDPITLGVSTAVDPDGHTQTYSYDDHGNRVSASDAAGNTTAMAFDDAGHQTQSISPTGLQTSTSYTVAGVPSSVTVNEIVQDAETGNPSGGPNTGTGTSADHRTTSFGYSDAAHPGELTSTTDPRGKTSTQSYDAFGNTTSRKDPVGDTSLMGYNTNTGWVTSTVSPAGVAAGVTAACTPPAKGCAIYGHDAWGHITATTDALNHKSAAGFDANGNQTSSTDANNHVTTTTFDAAGQPVLIKTADNNSTSTIYSATGKVAETVDGLGKHTVYGYDGQDRQISVTDANGKVSKTVLDPVGLKSSSTSAKGVVATYSYDSAGRMISLDYSDATPDVTALSYDANGKQLTLTDGTGTSSWAYDNYGELTSHTNGAGARVAYGYDDGGNQTSVTYPGQATAVLETYDDASRLATVTDFAGNKSSYSYNENSQVKSLSYPNGTTVNSNYDNAAQLASASLVKGSTTLASLSYGRDNMNQLTGQTPTGLPGVAKTYGYSSVNEVTSETTGSTVSSYTYDAAHNASKVRNGTQAFDAANSLCWSSTTVVTTPSCSTVPSGATSYSYDVDGNRTAAGAANYSYDGVDRLKAATVAGVSSSYTYDAAGLRASKTVGAVTTQFTWDDAQVPDLLSSGASNFIYGANGQAIEQVTGGAVMFYFVDQIGSIRALTDSTGSVTCGYSYDAYGKVSGHTGTASTPLQYAGGYSDTETGFVYFRARYLDPATTQFISHDPAFTKTLQWFAYAGNNPLNMVDPMGLDDWWNPGSWSGETWKNVGIGVGIAGAIIGGVALAATGVGLGIEIAGAAGLAISESAVAVGEVAGAVGLWAGAASTALDAGTCVGHLMSGDQDLIPCAGAALGAASFGFGGAASWGGTALLGEGGNSMKTGWDLGSGLFGAGGYGIDLPAFIHSCSGGEGGK